MMKLLMAVRNLTASVYDLRAENAALKSALLKAVQSALPEYQAAEIETFLMEQKEVELGKMILELGDSDPWLAEDLRKLLGRDEPDDV